MSTPTVVALHLNPGSREPLVAVPRVSAIPGGLEGDRHLKVGGNRTVLLVEQEVLDSHELEPGALREQVTVRGMDLMALAAGSRVSIGSATLEAGGGCAPCGRMDELKSGLRNKLVGRRGRFFSVVAAGAFAVGDPVVPGPQG
jgi:MOSC domain-containing protein YiiM